MHPDLLELRQYFPACHRLIRQVLGRYILYCAQACVSTARSSSPDKGLTTADISISETYHTVSMSAAFAVWLQMIGAVTAPGSFAKDTIGRTPSACGPFSSRLHWHLQISGDSIIFICAPWYSWRAPSRRGHAQPCREQACSHLHRRRAPVAAGTSTERLITGFADGSQSIFSVLSPTPSATLMTPHGGE
ncbi:hypothetical protein K458DRAFT_206936 [Lentithecium fluviatile CBS 122367]|uniref:Uncharacterized protein n=1 Tax=Lentithecium fluviatile CBS 122367 TaxID=1168545 RepID=A0A6G1J6Y0_9PLEO|nr:hypothetical protein K458DRAFT_206936 [Lentithecium fluviatile CBS 122367]